MSTPRSLDLPAGVRARQHATATGSLAVLEAGRPDAAGGPVLLVPGWTGSKEDFLAVLAPLASAGHHVLALDLPGQYESSPPATATYDLDGFAAAVLALAEALGAGPVHLVGHSFGGLVAQAAAVCDPAALRSLVLLCSGPGALPADQQPLVHALADAIERTGLEATWTAKREYDRAHGAEEAPPEIERFLRHRFVTNDPACLHAITLLLADAPDRVPQVAASGVPIAVVTGAQDDRWPVDVQADMAARLGARFVLLEAAGHSPAVDTPEATVAALTAWWSGAGARPEAVGE